MLQIPIITINTWKCDGNYRTRMLAMAAQLKNLAPGIIACQECFYTEEGEADTLHYLAGKLKMNYAFFPGRFKKRFFENKWVESYSGLGILSKYPIKSTEHFQLPIVADDDDRKAMKTIIALPDGSNLAITNLHLTHLKDVVAGRILQAIEVAEVALRGRGNKYNLVCGDFNAEPGSKELTSFMKTARAIDCYIAGNGPEPRYSVTSQYYDHKHVCIDHIFSLPLPGKKDYPQFVNSGVVLNNVDSESGVYPSDHFGIATTLVI
jgi:endonuclease/exonuclease/phosphatase family metal-dependent hydrolase